jgi:hypothetical protein
MLCAMVRIAPPQDCEARFFVDSSKGFEKGLGEKRGKMPPVTTPVTEDHHFTLNLPEISPTPL